MLRARHNKGYCCLQARHCPSYTLNILSQLWGWKISTRGTEGKKPTAFSWRVITLLGHFFPLTICWGAEPYISDFFLPPHFPCFLSSLSTSPVFQKVKTEESPSESAATAKSSHWEMKFGTKVRTKARLFTSWIPQRPKHHAASGQLCLLQAEFLKMFLNGLKPSNAR